MYAIIEAVTAPKVSARTSKKTGSRPAASRTISPVAGSRALEAGQDTAEPHDEDHPDIEQKTDEDHEIGPPAAVELADEIGAEKGQRVRQDPDGDGEDEGRPATGRQLAELDEPADAEDVEHGQGAEEEPGEDQEHPLAPCVEHRGLDGVEVVIVGHLTG